MDKKNAQQILSETKKHYSLAASHFSRARSRAWPEMKFLIDKYVKEKDKVLDLGCGNGRFSEFFLDYLGVDSSQELIDIARENNPSKNFLVADALNLPLTDQSFDLIFSVSVLHHIPSKRLRSKFLQESKRVLKPGGTMILTVWDLWSNPNKRFTIIKSSLISLIGLKDFKDIEIDWYGAGKCYLHAFSLRELEKLAQENRFSLISSGRIELKKKKNLSNFYLVLR
jgi:ubiquinone/menaquinone biosynthesis C-methylase UbiE